MFKKEIDKRTHDFNQQIDILKLLKMQCLNWEHIPPNWEELYDFKEKEEQVIEKIVIEDEETKK